MIHATCGGLRGSNAPAREPGVLLERQQQTEPRVAVTGLGGLVNPLPSLNWTGRPEPHARTFGVGFGGPGAFDTIGT